MVRVQRMRRRMWKKRLFPDYAACPLGNGWSGEQCVEWQWSFCNSTRCNGALFVHSVLILPGQHQVYWHMKNARILKNSDHQQNSCLDLNMSLEPGNIYILTADSNWTWIWPNRWVFAWRTGLTLMWRVWIPHLTGRRPLRFHFKSYHLESAVTDDRRLCNGWRD